MMFIHEYEIGGLCVEMTAAQAAAWNRGNWSEDEMASAIVFLPDAYETPSRLHNGEVVLLSPRLVECSRGLTLAEADQEGIYAEFMDGAPANLMSPGVREAEGWTAIRLADERATLGRLALAGFAGETLSDGRTCVPDEALDFLAADDYELA